MPIQVTRMMKPVLAQPPDPAVEVVCYMCAAISRPRTALDAIADEPSVRWGVAIAVLGVLQRADGQCPGAHQRAEPCHQHSRRQSRVPIASPNPCLLYTY